MAVILIVEDDPDSRLMLKLLLELWEYSVIEATDGSQAVKIAEKEKLDLILMDVKLPGIDGIEATRRIRKSEKTCSLPVVFLSACAEPIFKDAAMKAGGNRYLTKPVNFEELEMSLNKHLATDKC